MTTHPPARLNVYAEAILYNVGHMKTMLFYGAGWCADCIRSKTFLDSHKIQYNYIDIDAVPGAADKAAELNNGLRRIPTIVFPDGAVLVEPSNEQLAKELAIGLVKIA